MNKDAAFTHLHLRQARDADLFEDFCREGGRLPDDDVYVPPQHRPLNPEDEDDVVPDQHAAFGIQRATQRSREPAWRDLGLAELGSRGPPPPGRVVPSATAGGTGEEGITAGATFGIAGLDDDVGTGGGAGAGGNGAGRGGGGGSNGTGAAAAAAATGTGGGNGGGNYVSRINAGGRTGSGGGGLLPR